MKKFLTEVKYTWSNSDWEKIAEIKAENEAEAAARAKKMLIEFTGCPENSIKEIKAEIID